MALSRQPLWRALSRRRFQKAPVWAIQQAIPPAAPSEATIMIKSIIKTAVLVWLVYLTLCWLAHHGFISPVYTICFI